MNRRGMLIIGGMALAVAGGLVAGPRTAADEEPAAIDSRIVETAADEQILVHEALIAAPVEAVWKAYTTEEGYSAWAAPQARIDLQVGGTIQAHYDPSARIGDEGTVKLHIVNYVPEVLLTLRAEPQASWPESLRQDADRLTSVILFDRLADNRTKLRTYGIGYRNTPEHQNLLRYFRKANEQLLEKLKKQLEKPREEKE